MKIPIKAGCATALVVALVSLAPQIAHAHDKAWHAIFRDRLATVEFYSVSFQADDVLYLQVVHDRFEAGRSLESGVLADMKGEPSAPILKEALKQLKNSRTAMDVLAAKLTQLREIAQKNPLIPEYVTALDRILKDHPPVERISLTESRFANIARGKKQHEASAGSNLDEVLRNLSEDLNILREQSDQTIQAFRDVLPMAEQGGFAAMVLSGRAPLPDKVLQSADMTLTFAQFFNRACAATIAADMEAYPKGLEWLKKPVKGWQGESQK
jgi:hypothetical protein